MAAALAINKKSEALQGFDASVPDTMGSLAMSQFERADRGRLFQCLRERFEVKVGGLSQIGQSFLLSMTLAGSANFRTLGHKPVGF